MGGDLSRVWLGSPLINPLAAAQKNGRLPAGRRLLPVAGPRR